MADDKPAEDKSAEDKSAENGETVTNEEQQTDLNPAEVSNASGHEGRQLRSGKKDKESTKVPDASVHEGRQLRSHRKLTDKSVTVTNEGQGLDQDSAKVSDTLVQEGPQLPSQGIININSRIQELLNEDDGRSKSGTCHTLRSRRSNRSIHSCASDAAVKAACLRAKLRHLDIEAEQKLELERARLKLDKIRTIKELDIAEAAAEEYQTDDNVSQATSKGQVKLSKFNVDYVTDYLQSQQKYQEEIDDKPGFLEPNKKANHFKSHIPKSAKLRTAFNSNLNPGATNFVPYNDASNEILSIALQNLEAHRLPVPEPEVFYGDPLKYPEWKCAFSILIERKSIPPQEKLYYLKRYLGGEAKEVIEGLFFLQHEGVYEKAKAMLDKRFGDPFTVADAFRNKIEAWPKLQSRDGPSLRRFADFLRQCDIAMTTVKGLRFLNDDRENRKLLQKCPEWIVNRWARTVTDYKNHLGDFPSFKDFVDFLEKEANIACDPVTSTQPHRDNKEEFSRSGVKRQVGANTLATETSRENNRWKKPGCFFCKGEHYIDVCEDFLKKSVEDRKHYVKHRGLCFGCLIPGHKSSECRIRKTCAICEKRHPSALHEDYSSSKTESTNQQSSAATGDGAQAFSHLNRSELGQHRCSMIVPVWVSHKDEPNVSKLVYALLDTQSDTTFVLDKTYRDLNLQGVEVDLCLSTMYAENKIVKSVRVEGLVVRGYRCTKEICLPPTYTRNIMPVNRAHIPTPEVAKKWPHLAVLQDMLEPMQNCDVALLIGYNCPQALIPRDVIVAYDDQGPFGQRSDLGWGIIGITEPKYIEDDRDVIGVSHRIIAAENLTVQQKSTQKYGGRTLFSCKKRVKEIISPDAVTRMFEQDFSEKLSMESTLSQDDRSFLRILRGGLKKSSDNHYEMPLPFRFQGLHLPNSRPMAMKRLLQLKTRLQKRPSFHNDYNGFMNKMLLNGYAEKISESELAGREGMIWYIPHQGVYQPSKPDKIRVVFDASAVYMGYSLNKQLLQGPDMINSLIGVLCRFRKQFIAFTCDIEQMFYQFKVLPGHKDYLRFLWWEDGCIDKEPVDYRMTVHLFGATSSPGCANFCLKHIAEEARELYPEAAKFISRDFYVDDGITSVPTKEQAIKLIEQTRNICTNHGMRLHKFVSNCKDVMQGIPWEDRSEAHNRIRFEHDALHMERTLGVEWCVESDMLHFRITLKDKPFTRRGVLATICSLYDPLGFVAPFTLIGKSILQEICKEQTGWDGPLSEDIRAKWEKWRAEILLLGKLQVPRCFLPRNFGEIIKAELHHFSDASYMGYGQCSYLRVKDNKGHIHCSLVMGKSRVAPLKAITIPRLELTAALVSVRVSQRLVTELEYSDITEIFWTDSQVVLGYINNDVRRFNIFVANRVQQIRDYTKPLQWKYVASKQNPADEASRGLTAEELLSSTWLTGPTFLLKDQIPQFGDASNIILEDDPEVKVTALSTQTSEEKSGIYFGQFSSWKKVTLAVALCLRYIDILRNRTSGSKIRIERYVPCTVQELAQAGRKIIRLVQKESFTGEVMTNLQGTSHLGPKLDRSRKPDHIKKTSPIYKLNPFVDKEGLLRVGGRLKYGSLSLELKHPVILPKNHHISRLIATYCHEKVQHQGRGLTLNEIRNHGYWIIGCTSLVYHIVSKCITCRRIHGKPQEQKMADLPEDRMSRAPPFTYVGSDYFGPWIIREGRKEIKRYGVIFTCMASRAVHLETANSLTTDSFINALRRFMAIRGPIRLLRSDQGTNFVGATNELKKAMGEMDQSKVQEFLLQNNCDYVHFKKNVPSASHQGGVWERQIRSVRRVLSVLLHQNGTQLCDETFRTFMYEAAAIINSRPLTVDTLNDAQSAQPLSPNNLLTMKTSIVLPPPGEFNTADMYCRARWRRVQHLANEFWNRWRKEYLQNIQIRSKWNVSRPDLKVGNLVIIKDDSLPRNLWKLARVTEVFQGSDGHVRSVKLAVAQANLDGQGRRRQPVTYLERPVQKLVLLLEESNEGTLVEEPQGHTAVT